MEFRSKEKSLAAKVFRKMADEASMEDLISARARNRVEIGRCLADGRPIPDSLLPGRMLERMKDRLSEDEKESIKSLTSDLIQDRLFGV